MRTSSKLVQCLAAIALTSFATRAAAVEITDDVIAKGAALATKHCGKCHAVGTDDASPARANANAAFRSLHERYPIAMLVEARKTGSISGHDEMPGFDFTEADMTALLAYIDSLNPGTPGYVTPAAR